jgi:hypothetical protein
MAIYDDRDRMQSREAAAEGHGALLTALAVVAIFAGLFAFYRFTSMNGPAVDNRPAITRDSTPNPVIPTIPREPPVPRPAPQ